MANGRLGKALVAPVSTVQVYKNTSGAEAVVSIIAQSSSGDMILKLDATTDSLLTTTTLVSEAYNERYLNYAVVNTALTDPAPVYVSRFEAKDKSTLNNANEIADFLVVAGSTTYSAKTTTNLSTSRFYMPYDTWLDVWGTADYAWSNACVVARNRVCSFANVSGGTKAIDSPDSFGLRIIKGESTSRIGEENIDYVESGLALDFWNIETPWGIGIQDAGYITGFALNVVSSGTSIETDNNTTNSWAYNGGILYPQMSGNIANNAVLCENKTAIIQCLSSTFFRLNLFRDDLFTVDGSASTRSIRMGQASHQRAFQFDNVKTRIGGQVMYYNYNPTDGLHYICFFNNQNALKLIKIDATACRLVLTNGQIIGLDATDADMSNATYSITDLTSSLSLTQPTAFAFASDVNNTTRCYFIGTQASPVWSLVFSKYNSTTAPEVRYSTDLITWKTPSDFYSPSDYQEIAGVTTVASNSGVLTASRSAIGSLGTDGVLEDPVSFNLYERTGLVLSNNDRVLVYNSGANNISIQVMGFEGG